MRASLRFSLLGATLTEQMSISNTAACAGYGHTDVKGVGNVISPIMVGKCLSLQVQQHASPLQDYTTFKRALCSAFNYSMACETPAFFMKMNETGDSYLFESPTRNAAALCWQTLCPAIYGPNLNYRLYTKMENAELSERAASQNDGRQWWNKQQMKKSGFHLWIESVSRSRWFSNSKWAWF